MATGNVRGLELDWTLDTLRIHFLAILEERDATKVEVEKRTSERFAALKEHFEALRGADKEAVVAALAAAEKAVSAALTSADKAVAVSEVAAKEWRAASNEWRGAMDDRDRKAQAALEKYAQKEVVEQRLAALERWQAKLLGAGAALALLAGVIGGIVARIIAS
jgi:hypothetical protein